MTSVPSPPARENGRSSPQLAPANNTPNSSGFRHRPLSRATTFGDPPTLKKRRSSVFSDLSDSKRSIRDSTEELFLPRAKKNSRLEEDHDTSHWHSIPLGLALLPAVGGLIFEGGSAVVTDVTLLALAAVFLNWSVRIPWDWYKSAQATRTSDVPAPTLFDPIIEEESEREDSDDPAVASSQEIPPPETVHGKTAKQSKDSSSVDAAQKELQAHELLALLSCFISPAAGAWLLHAIRSQLSRPSEGLVSNYNLMIFLLAAEIRPISHLIKMIQARTLFLQRIVISEGSPETLTHDNASLIDLTHRISELENHVADSAVKAEEQSATSSPPTTENLTTSVRQSIQSELDALTRAVRKYEKRTTMSALQTDARLQDLESRLQDAIVLAAAAQRSVQRQPDNFVLVLVNWASAAIVLPVRFTWAAVNFPVEVVGRTLGFVRRKTGSTGYSGKPRKMGEGRKGRPGLGGGVERGGGLRESREKGGRL